MQKIGKISSIATQIENVSSNHLMAQIHFVQKYTTYMMKMVPGSKEFVCLENVMMMFLALLLEIFAYPGQYLGLVQTANVVMIQSLPFLNVEFLHCLQNQHLHRLRDSQKICSADEPSPL